jgi:DNA repair exonuclease SbcCD nuclease subunit
MPSLGVVLLDLLARFSGLLDNEVVRLRCNDPLYVVVLVPGNHDEVESLTENSLILDGGNEHLLDAGGVAAFAVERERSRNVMLFSGLVDASVDAAEYFLVSRGCFCEVHEAEYHSWSSCFRDTAASGSLLLRR